MSSNATEAATATATKAAARSERRQAKRRTRQERIIRGLQRPCTCRPCRASRPPVRWPANYVGSTGWSYEHFLEFWQQHVEDEARREMQQALGRRRWRWLQLAALREILAPVILAGLADPAGPIAIAAAAAEDAGLAFCPPGRLQPRASLGGRAYCERCDRRKRPKGPGRPRYCLTCQPRVAAELAAAQWTEAEIAAWMAGEDLVATAAAAAASRQEIAAAAQAATIRDAANPSTN